MQLCLEKVLWFRQHTYLFLKDDVGWGGLFWRLDSTTCLLAALLDLSHLFVEQFVANWLQFILRVVFLIPGSILAWRANFLHSKARYDSLLLLPDCFIFCLYLIVLVGEKLRCVELFCLFFALCPLDAICLACDGRRRAQIIILDRLILQLVLLRLFLSGDLLCILWWQ